MATQVYTMAEQYDPNYNQGGFGDQPNSTENNNSEHVNGDGQQPLSPTNYFRQDLAVSIV
jgi:hypothetical protein